MTTTVTLSIGEKYKRVKIWAESLAPGERSKKICEALEEYLSKQRNITLTDIYDAVQELKRHGVVIAQQDGKQMNDPELAEALENLGKLGL